MGRATTTTRTNASRCAAAALAALLLAGAASAGAGEVEDLRRTSARLEARVQELEAELAALRAAGAHVGADAAAAGPAAPGARMESVYIPRSRVSLEVSRDAASGATGLATLWYRTADVGLLPRKEWLQLRAQQDRDGGLEAVWLLVERQGAAAGKPSVGRLTVDGTVIELPVAEHDVRRKSQAIGPISTSARDERIRFTMPPGVPAQVAAAQIVRFDAGTIAFELTDEHVAAFAAMATRIGGAQPAPARPGAAPAHD